MNILLVIPSLAIGGAEVFTVRLANHLAEQHTVYLLDLAPDHRSSLLMRRIRPEINLVTYSQKLSFFQNVFWKIVSLLIGSKRETPLTVWYRRKKLFAKVLAKFLDTFCSKHNIDVIHSHLSFADWAVAHYFQQKRTQKFVISAHGCYNRIEREQDPKLLRMKMDDQFSLGAADHIVLLTPKNAEPLNGLQLKHAPVFIPLGFESVSQTPAFDTDDTFTFVLVSRAIERKGWEQAISATIALNNQGYRLRLVLVGGSPYQEHLKRLHGSHDYITFAGAQSNVLQWIGLGKVGLFPSYIESESFPNTVIEYLACGIPVIGTDIGEVRQMMSSKDGRHAGFLLNYAPEGISVEQLMNFMRSYLTDSALLAEHRSIADSAFEKFNMRRCLEAYENLYR